MQIPGPCSVWIYEEGQRWPLETGLTPEQALFAGIDALEKGYDHVSIVGLDGPPPDGTSVEDHARRVVLR